MGGYLGLALTCTKCEQGKVESMPLSSLKRKSRNFSGRSNEHAVINCTDGTETALILQQKRRVYHQQSQKRRPVSRGGTKHAAVDDDSNSSDETMTKCATNCPEAAASRAFGVSLMSGLETFLRRFLHRCDVGLRSCAR